jgi:hypothetical protein
MSYEHILLFSVHVFTGMSVRDVVIEFKHKVVLLFKLILLERRVSILTYTHHFFGNACTKSGSLRFSQFSGC